MLDLIGWLMCGAFALLAIYILTWALGLEDD